MSEKGAHNLTIHVLTHNQPSLTLEGKVTTP